MSQNTVMQSHHSGVLSSAIADMVLATENIEHNIEDINTHIIDINEEINSFGQHLRKQSSPSIPSKNRLLNQTRY